MKNWLYFIYIGLVGSLVSSCQQSLDEVVQESTIGKAEITFTIALEEIDSRSQTSWADNESSSNSEGGSVYDNQIDLTSEDGLQVFVYSLDNIFLGEVTDKDVFRLNDNTYKFNGKLTIENLSSSSLPCRLMVYANCINGTQTFTYDVDYVPMWGVMETTLKLAQGELTNISKPIHLLRAMAKMEVKLHEDIATDFDIASVEVDKFNTVGNVLPNGTLSATATEVMDQNEIFNPNNSATGENLAFAKISNDEFCVYLPEYDNSVPATITVYIGEKRYMIEFKNYIDGKAIGEAYNIVRNHYYQYTITKVGEQSVEVNLALKYQVEDWTNVTNPNLDFK